MMLSEQRLRRVFGFCGIAGPVIYFVGQLLAAPFYEGYSFRVRDASELGSDASSFPAIFNGAMAVSGVMMLVAAVGFLREAWSSQTDRRLLKGLFAIAVFAGAIGCFNAAVFPLPDPRHTSGLFAQLGAFLFLAPLLGPFVLRAAPDTHGARWLLFTNLMILLMLFPIFSGLVQRIAGSFGSDLPRFQLFLNHNSGLLQRVAAITAFAPIGYLARRLFLADRSAYLAA